MGAGDVNVRSDITYERYRTPKPAHPLGAAARRRPARHRRRIRWDGPQRPAAPAPDDRRDGAGDAPTRCPTRRRWGAAGRIPRDSSRTTSADRPVRHGGRRRGDRRCGGRRGCSTGPDSSSTPARTPTTTPGSGPLSHDASLVLTDTNRRQSTRWSTVRETNGYTERAGQKSMRYDPTDQRLVVFPAAGDSSRTVRVSEGQAWRRVHRLRQPGHLHARGPTGVRHRRRPGQPGHRLAHQRLLQRDRAEAAHPLQGSGHQRQAVPAPGAGWCSQPVHHRGQADVRRQGSRDGPARQGLPPQAGRGPQRPEAHVQDARHRDRQHRSGPHASVRRHGRGRVRGGEPEAGRQGLAQRRRRHPVAGRPPRHRRQDVRPERPVDPAHPDAHRRHELRARRRRAEHGTASGTSPRAGSSRSAGRSGSRRGPATR